MLTDILKEIEEQEDSEAYFPHLHGTQHLTYVPRFRGNIYLADRSVYIKAHKKEKILVLFLARLMKKKISVLNKDSDCVIEFKNVTSAERGFLIRFVSNKYRIVL